MPTITGMTFTRFLYLLIICLVICPLSPPAGAEDAEDLDQVVIDARDVQDSIESCLEAIAINGRAIPATAYPEAGLGDVITFRVRVHNAYPGTLKSLHCGADWGKGFVFEGNLGHNQVECSYDADTGKIVVDIDEIPGDSYGSEPAGEPPAASERWYAFDLKVADCEDLSVNVHTDELYSCQSIKTYYAAPGITTPEIRYTVSTSSEKIIFGEKQPVAVSIDNIGDGRAAGFIMETNLEKFPATITAVSPGFVYGAQTGAFIADGAIDPGQSMNLNFDLVIDTEDCGDLPEGAILFAPSYTDDCGLRFRAPETLVALRPSGQGAENIIRGANLGVEISVQLPDAVEGVQAQDVLVTISRTRPRDFYDLDVVLNAENHLYQGDLATNGFDGQTPRVDTSKPGQIIFSFDHDPCLAEPLTQGGSLRFKVKKRASTLAGIKASARFVDRLAALAAQRETPAGQALDLLKREVHSYVGPLLHEAPGLVVRVTPECCRLEPGEFVPWNIYVTNTGNAAAADVKLKDVMANNLMFHKVGDEDKIAPRVKEDDSAFGQTTLEWDLGEIPPSRTRKVSVVVLCRADKEHSDVLVNTNTIGLASDCEGDACHYQDTAAPCFILPDECISGDVFEEPGRIHGFLSLTQIYKSNLYESDIEKKKDWATYITPGIWVALPGSHDRLVDITTTSSTPGGLAVSPYYPENDRRYQAYLLYSPQWEMYAHESQNNMVSHRVDGYFHYNSGNKFSIKVIDQFKRSHDSVSSRIYTIDDKYKTNLFSAVSDLDLTEKFGLRLDYSNFRVNYEDSDNDINDRVDNSWAAYGFFHLTPKISLFAEYEYADMDYRSNFLDSSEERYFGGIRWEFTEKTSGQVKAGYGDRDYDKSWLSDTGTTMAEVVVDYDMTEKTRIVFNAYRRYEEAMSTGLRWDGVPTGNLATNMLTHMVGLSINYDITSKLHLNLHSTIFYDEYDYEYEDDAWKGVWDDKERRDREIAVSPQIKFDVFKWLSLDLAYIYTHLDSNYSEEDYTDHTVFLRANLFR